MAPVSASNPQYAYPALLLIVPLFKSWLKQGLEAIRSDMG